MKRRAFLKYLAGASALALPCVSMARQARPRVGVVGGGIVGTSICLHLARAGAEVTLFERESPAAGATSKSFAWLNATQRHIDSCVIPPTPDHMQGPLPFWPIFQPLLRTPNIIFCQRSMPLKKQ